MQQPPGYSSVPPAYGGDYSNPYASYTAPKKSPVGAIVGTVVVAAIVAILFIFVFNPSENVSQSDLIGEWRFRESTSHPNVFSDMGVSEVIMEFRSGGKGKITMTMYGQTIPVEFTWTLSRKKVNMEMEGLPVEMTVKSISTTEMVIEEFVPGVGQVTSTYRKLR
jgi:hypothetical protein